MTKPNLLDLIRLLSKIETLLLVSKANQTIPDEVWESLDDFISKASEEVLKND